MADDEDAEGQHRASDLKLLESGNFADVTVTCGDKSWKVHKIILCSRSKWFEKALTGGFKVGPSCTSLPKCPLPG